MQAWGPECNLLHPHKNYNLSTEEVEMGGFPEFLDSQSILIGDKSVRNPV